MKTSPLAIVCCIIVPIFLSCSDTPSEIVVISGPIDLENTRWRVYGIETAAGVFVKLAPNDTITLFFGSDYRTTGTSSGLCGNHYSAVYTPKREGLAGYITFDSLTTTEMACNESMYHEYFNKLQSVAVYYGSPTTLSLYYTVTPDPDSVGQSIKLEKIP